MLLRGHNVLSFNPGKVTSIGHINSQILLQQHVTESLTSDVRNVPCYYRSYVVHGVAPLMQNNARDSRSGILSMLSGRSPLYAQLYPTLWHAITGAAPLELQADP